MTHHEELSKTIDHLSHPGKGILAADESNGTIGKRFDSIGIENTENNRRDYRLLLASTENLEQYISGVILFEETFTHHNQAGISVPQLFAEKNILPGIKVDKGLINLPNTDDEKITQGLDGLEERLLHFKSQGAKFAKWRNVFKISDFTPSLVAVKAGAETLARYATTCQNVGIVPIVEPEVLIDGDHSIEHAAEASEVILHEVFNALFLHQVALECMILKPSMITCGQACTPFSTPEEIAEYTLSVFRNQVPAAVPSINFLSGGQTPEQSIINLNAINNFSEQPWMLSFSYGRALQEHCLQAWSGVEANIPNAQAALLKAAEANSLAACGEYNTAS
ncbi:MAG: fructose-bisphosphate aldolase class I [Legionellaceae bacterium]|nr:fructose-bisphosphate aldolase class I [Legionellaceae bacterium]